MGHRYAARAGHQDAYSVGSPNFATHCVISTDNMGVLSGGIFDYPVMIQEISLAELWLLQERVRLSGATFCAVTLCFDHINLEPLPPSATKSPSQYTLPILRMEHNHLVHLTDLRLEG